MSPEEISDWAEFVLLPTDLEDPDNPTVAEIERGAKFGGYLEMEYTKESPGGGGRMTDYNTTVMQATGNNLDRPDQHTFLEVSGGGGNTGAPEVHLMMWSNDGEFAQGWFNLDQLEDAVRRAGEASE